MTDSPKHSDLQRVIRSGFPKDSGLDLLRGFQKETEKGIHLDLGSGYAKVTRKVKGWVTVKRTD